MKITNRANETLNLKDFGGLYFSFAKTLPVSRHRENIGFYGIDERVITPGETFEFEVDLKKLARLEPASKDSTYIPDSENRAPYYLAFQVITPFSLR